MCVDMFRNGNLNFEVMEEKGFDGALRSFDILKCSGGPSSIKWICLSSSVLRSRARERERERVY